MFLLRLNKYKIPAHSINGMTSAVITFNQVLWNKAENYGTSCLLTNDFDRVKSPS